ncbi:MAG: hypothetical protein CMN56_05315 [Sneathiella sp.]|uniref:hypothetical protein n=1 Tax=Sneathiella sp. TaxID=1964365 RepID=UPI000C53D3E1|nr:hypothetical protein [Sneathiella sp.]MAZ02539.1 hypothetical protein [Sneathiella sp.]
MWDFLKDFQTGIVGILGFAGVILTLWWNARLQRKSREHEIEIERKALHIALLTELNVVHKIFSYNIRTLSENMEKMRIGQNLGDLAYGFDEPSRVFDANIHKIGLLGQEGAGKVLSAFLPLATVSNRLLLYGTLHSSGQSVLIDPAHIHSIHNMYQGHIGKIEAATRWLSEHQE